MMDNEKTGNLLAFFVFVFAFPWKWLHRKKEIKAVTGKTYYNDDFSIGVSEGGFKDSEEMEKKLK